MKRFGKPIVLLLCCAMILSFTACGTKETTQTPQSSQTPAGSSTQATTTVKANPYEKKLEITWLGFFAAGLPQEFWAKTEIEKQFNVKITVPDVDANTDKQKVNLMIASGEMPDFFANMGENVQNWYNEKVTRTIPVDLVKKSAPNYSKVMNDNPAGWKLFALKDKPAELMAMTGFTPTQVNQVMFTSHYRLDWLEKIGMKPKGNLVPIDSDNNVFYTDQGFTRDEFVKIMDKFVNEDPDGNGQKDTLGFIGCNNFAHTWYSLMGSFGFTINNLEENGQTIEYYSSVKYKEFLKFAAMLYKNGYMDKEFFTLDFTKMQEKYAKQKAGYVSTSPTYIVKTNQTLWGRAPLNMIKDNANAKLVIVPPEIGPNGEQAVPYNTNTPFKYAFQIGSSVSDEKLERILNIFDYSACSKEGFQKFAYGIEGTHYTIQDSAQGKIKVLKDGVKANGAPDGLFLFALNMFLPDDGRTDVPPPTKTPLMTGVLNNAKWISINKGPYRIDLYNDTNIAKVKADTFSAIDTIVREFYAKSISGEINVDNEWDGYIAKLNKAGYDKIVAENNKAPKYNDVMNKK